MSGGKYKICFILASMQGGGMESLVKKLSDYYSCEGHQVSIILLFKVKNNFFLPDNRVRVFEPEIIREGNNKYLYSLRLLPFIRRTVRQLKPDVIVGHGEWTNPYVILSTLGFKIPVYLEDHMNPELDLGIIHNLARKLTYKHASGIIALTEFAAKITREKTGASNIEVIPNPVIIEESPGIRKQNSIVTVGRLSKEKGHKILIEAFCKLKETDWSLEIVGDGEERSSLERIVREKGIEGRVVFHGYMRNFWGVLSKAEIFVLPSLSECYPLALIEAMAVPLACITTDSLGGKDIIVKNGENGLVVRKGDPDELANSIEYLINDRQLRISLAQNAVKIREELDIKVISYRYLEFITRKLSIN